ncbi:MAG TPA: Mg2+ and Co2+ transporter CorB [Verrucomicrobiales bacterium]|nr:Mg2+ and Co2+ transporter CorB [Verrucomicrobiales bacterium]
MNEVYTWVGIGFCVSQSAMFSGLNLAVFSVGRLRLQVEAARQNPDAIKVLRLRRESNWCLATILWGNVGINVLLTLLADSILAGLTAFLFSTFVITLLGEILPQAYFSRNALRMAALLSPALRFYQFLLYPVTRPTGAMLDRWLGPEATAYLPEDRLRELIRQHIRQGTGEVDAVEGIGAMNFLSMDDLPVGHEGEILDRNSIVALPCEKGMPVFPAFNPDTEDPFIRQVQRSGKSWVVVTNPEGDPVSVIDANGFLRAVLFQKSVVSPRAFCHQPVVVDDPDITIGQVIGRLKVNPEHPSDDVIDQDVILVWGEYQKRIITGSDILGRLLRGIVKLNWAAAVKAAAT